MTLPAEPDLGAITPSPARPRSATAFVAAALLVVLTLFAFSPTLDNDFVNWDDTGNFLTNESFRGLGVEQVRWAWTTFHMGAYQPLAWMLASVEYEMFALDPRGFQAVSVALHAITIPAVRAGSSTGPARARRRAAPLALIVFTGDPDARVTSSAFTRSILNSLVA